MDETYRAPDLAKVPEFCRESGRSSHETYRMIEHGTIPHMRVGERTIRILMRPYRRMIDGEPIDERLLKGHVLTTSSEDGN